MEITKTTTKRELIEGLLADYPRFANPDEAVCFGFGFEAGMTIAILKMKEFLSELEDWASKPGPPRKISAD